MPGYDITQFDAPGILSIYQGAQDRRINQMLVKRKIDLEDRALQQQNQKMDLARKVFGLQPGGGGQPSGGGGLAAPYASPPQAGPAPIAGAVTTPLAQPYAAPGTINANHATGSPLSSMGLPDQTVGPAAPAVAPQTLVDPSALPPRTDGLRLNQDALRQLYVLDPDMATGLQNMVFNADKKQFEAVARNGEIMATAAYDVKKLPPERRRAEVTALIPYLTANGVPADQLTPEALDKIDLSDAGLDRLIITGRKLSDVIDDDRAANSVQWIRADNGDGTFTMMPMGRNGQPLGGGKPGPQVGEIEGGYRFKGGDPADKNNWESVGGPKQPASGTFR